MLILLFVHNRRHFQQRLTRPLKHCNHELRMRFNDSRDLTINVNFFRISHDKKSMSIYFHTGRGGAFVETMPLDRRVVGSNPALAATWGP